MSDLCKSPWAEWETVRVIGRGSFGTVYEIRRRLVDGTVETAAMKVITLPQNPGDVEELRGEGYDDESITATFQSHLKSIVAEYTLMRKLDGSANVVNCKDIRYIQHDNGMGWDIFIRMELLTPLLKALPENVPEETVVRLGRDIASALVLCRKHSIIHRDIKPQNIFISDNADYKLGDFGIAKTVEKTMGGTKIGTYKYMAPEVYNNQPYGSGADIYSLGLVLYWLLNERRMPFMPLPPAKILAGQDEQARQRRLSGEKLPPPAHGSRELQRIVLKACAYDPKNRYHTADEMLEELEALGSGDSKDDRTAGVYTAYADTKDETVGTQGIFGTAKTSGTASTAKAKKRQNPDSTKKESSKSLRAVFAVVLLACITVAAFGYSHCWFGHKWVEATCTTPRMCTVCGKTVGKAAGHRWIAATYSSPKKCSVCGTTEGTALVKSSTSEKTTSTVKETPPPVKEATAPTETKTAPSLSVGDRIMFGHFEQDGNTSNGKDTIEWRVLSVSGNRALLISEYGLDGQPFDTHYRPVTWSDCTLRTWLNTTFLNNAFSASEQNAIQLTNVDNSNSQGYSGWKTSGGQDTQDKVFLLSYAEAWEYFASDSDRACYATTYALSREAEQHDPDNHSWWWLRSPGETDSHAAYVNFNGTVYSNAVGNDYVSVRPALWIDIATYQTLND